MVLFMIKSDNDTDSVTFEGDEKLKTTLYNLKTNLIVRSHVH